MSGIDIAEEVTASQLEALAGGELLKAEVSVMPPSSFLCCSHLPFAFSVHTTLKSVTLRSHHSVFESHWWMPISVCLSSF